MRRPFGYEQARCLPTMVFHKDTFYSDLCMMNILCGTNYQVSAQLFDLQGAYKAMMDVTILY